MKPDTKPIVIATFRHCEVVTFRLTTNGGRIRLLAWNCTHSTGGYYILMIKGFLSSVV